MTKWTPLPPLRELSTKRDTLVREGELKHARAVERESASVTVQGRCAAHVLNVVLVPLVSTRRTVVEGLGRQSGPTLSRNPAIDYYTPPK